MKGGEQGGTSITRCLHKDGQMVWFELHATAFQDDTGNGYNLVVINDVTERRRVEAALEELNETLEQRVEERTEQFKHSEQRFAQAFYSNPIPACMTTFGREIFVEVNNAFLTLTGYEHDEIVGKSSRALAMWSSPQDQKKLSEAQRHARGFHNLELNLRTKEGALRDILISAEVIRLDDDDGYLKMFYDITARKATEEQMHQAIQHVMTDTNWFSRRIIERQANIKSGSTEEAEVIDFSKRERQVLERMSGGMDNTAIAAELGIAVQTVCNYVSSIMVLCAWSSLDPRKAGDPTSRSPEI